QRGAAGLVLRAAHDPWDEAGEVAVTRPEAAAVRVVAEVGGDEGETGREVGPAAELQVLLGAGLRQVRVVRGGVVPGRVEQGGAAVARLWHGLLERAPARAELGEDARPA